MVELFSNFTTTILIIAALVSIGIIFEEQFIALEDKFDAFVARLFSQKKQQSEQAKANTGKKRRAKQENKSGMKAA